MKITIARVVGGQETSLIEFDMTEQGPALLTYMDCLQKENDPKAHWLLEQGAALAAEGYNLDRVCHIHWRGYYFK